MAAIGIVPVVHDDREAPGGCTALCALGGRSLVQRAVEVLIGSGRIRRVIIPAPPALVGSLSGWACASEPVADVEVRVVPVEENTLIGRVRGLLVNPRPSERVPGRGPGKAAGALDSGAIGGDENAAGRRPGAAQPGHGGLPTGPQAIIGSELVAAPEPVVVVHDPLHPLVPPGLVRAVVDALGGAGDTVVACVPVGPVTDTLVWVGEDGVVMAPADRGTFRVAQSPQAFRVVRFATALAAAGPTLRETPGIGVLPRVVENAGGRLQAVTGLTEAFRIAGTDDLVLAEAVHQHALRAVGARTSPAGARPPAGRARR